MIIRDIFASYDALYDVAAKASKPAEENEDFSPVKDSSESSGQNSDSREKDSETPAVELIFSNGMMREIRFLSQKARDIQSNLNAGSEDGSSTKLSRMHDRCATLKAKASDLMITSGEKTYIQSEIDRIKRQMCTLDVAL